MYHHNYTYFKSPYKELKMRSLMEEEIAVRRSEKGDFCDIKVNSKLNPAILGYIKYPSEVTTFGFYTFKINRFDALSKVDGIEVKQVTSIDNVEDLLFCDLKADEARLGRDFCIRRCYRRGQVYILERGVNAYVAYKNGEIIGCCDLFIHDGVAKIEDFSIIEAYQRKGYGTTLLKAMIGKALEAACHTIYLVTDEDDTAREMYLKLGFDKIGEMKQIHFSIK
jgi:spore maturation protein CgeE